MTKAKEGGTTMEYGYTVTVVQDADPRIIEEDIEIVLDRLGYEGYEVNEQAAREFDIVSPRRLNIRAVRRDIEACSARRCCIIRLERYQ